MFPMGNNIPSGKHYAFLNIPLFRVDRNIQESTIHETAALEEHAHYTNILLDTGEQIVLLC